jgi:hypothetical protein
MNPNPLLLPVELQAVNQPASTNMRHFNAQPFTKLI